MRGYTTNLIFIWFFQRQATLGAQTPTMNIKTPVSFLTELATHYKVAPPRYDDPVREANDPKLFVSIVRAFNKLGKGTGVSKADAKHAASQAIIGKNST